MVAVSSVSVFSFLMPYIIHGGRSIRLFDMTDIINAITDVFDAVSSWIQTALNNMIPVFWTAGTGGSAGQLTLIGVLTVVALGFSVVFLVLGLLQRWFKFGA